MEKRANKKRPKRDGRIKLKQKALDLFLLARVLLLLVREDLLGEDLALGVEGVDKRDTSLELEAGDVVLGDALEVHDDRSEGVSVLKRSQAKGRGVK